MDLLSLKEYTLGTINYLLDNCVEENIHLDYKAGSGLKTNDAGRNDITKDVSSFANSDGGIIIYGIEEGKDNDKHKPVGLSTFDGNVFNKEWLEQKISLIQPHIKGITIHPIRIDGDVSQSIYVVKIPRSNDTPHMATDKRYYKRFNFNSSPMEHYEVMDLLGRSNKIDLIISSCESDCKRSNEDGFCYYTFKFNIENVGKLICNDFKISFILSCANFVDDYKFIVETDNYTSLSKSKIDNALMRYTFSNNEIIFPTESIEYIVKFSIPIDNYKNFSRDSIVDMVLWYNGGPRKYQHNISYNELKEMNNLNE